MARGTDYGCLTAKPAPKRGPTGPWAHSEGAKPRPKAGKEEPGQSLGPAGTSAGPTGSLTSDSRHPERSRMSWRHQERERKWE